MRTLSLLFVCAVFVGCGQLDWRGSACGVGCLGDEIGETGRKIAGADEAAGRQWHAFKDHVGPRVAGADEGAAEQYHAAKDHLGKKANESRDYLWNRGLCETRHGDDCNGRPTDGTDGKDGMDGTQGPAGQDGSDGAQGPQGPQGPAGNAGDTGADGKDGMDGSDGSNGDNGSDGIDGTSCSSFKEADRCRQRGRDYFIRFDYGIVCGDESRTVLKSEWEEVDEEEFEYYCEEE